MVGLIPPQTVLTQNSASNDLQSKGLQALGLAAPVLSPNWAASDPTQADYDEATLSIKLTDPRAVFLGVATWMTDASSFSDVQGKALTGTVLALRLHPEAARRLQVAIDLRTGSNVYPIPVAMVVRGLTAPATLPVPQIYLAGETLGTGMGTTTFHDARGLPIDPLALACLCNDLLTWRPGLNASSVPGLSPGGPGGVGNMINIAPGVLMHVVDPHGWRYATMTQAAQISLLDGTGASVAALPDTGLLTVDTNQMIGLSNGDLASLPAGASSPLRWGFSRNATLGTTALVPPALNGVNLPRRFFRVMAVNLDWHVLGNRTTSKVIDLVAGDVPGDDGSTPTFLLPRVRDPVPNFTWLADGVDVLGAMGAQMQAFGNPGDQLFAVAVSPVIDPLLAIPPGAGPASHWPAFPAPSGAPQEISTKADPRQNASAQWRDPGDGVGAVQDVILTLDGTALPLGAHVRAYPRRFVEIAAIGDQPSFVRGDGGSAIVTAGPIKLLLINPLALGSAEPHPAGGELMFDLVVISRSGRRRLYSAVKLVIGAGPESLPTPSPLGGTQIMAPGTLLAQVLDGMMSRSIAPVPLFGLPHPPDTRGPPTSLTDLMRRLATDEQPRQGPRLPTQARFDTAFVTGVMPAVDMTYRWRATVTGARLTPESLCARPEQANAGNPAGPDVYAAGTTFQGALAWDVAVHALKRAMPMFIPTGPTSFRGWVTPLMDSKFGDPVPDTTGTVAAAMLETVATMCDTPELAAADVPQPGATLQNLFDYVSGLLGISPPPQAPNIPFEQRIVRAVQREIATARSGQRDALWSLTRAIGQARELIYIESPGFARTADLSTPPKPYELDLVQYITSQMAVSPRLKVVLCVPREGDFDRSKANWTVTAMRRRKEAIQAIVSVDPKRIVAFHPIGYPGRPPAIRATTVIVDDVYCFTGSSHFRRRGMTFDGGLDIASIDKTMTESYSSGIASFRRQLMAAKLGVASAATVPQATSLWVRLGTPESAFQAVFELLQEGGAGRLEAVWAGATPDTVLPQPDNVVDPDGVTGNDFLELFASLVIEG